MAPEQPQITSSNPAKFQPLCWLITTAQSTLLSHFSATTPAQLDVLRPGLEDLALTLKLYYIYSSFQQSVKQVDKSWIPKGRIEQVVRACCNQRYREHDIERIFYEGGGINGVLVLHLGTRFQNAMFAQIYALPLELVEELARKCGKEEVSTFVKTWAEEFDKSRREFDPNEPPPRLDRFAKDKEIRLSSQASLRRKPSQSSVVVAVETKSPDAHKTMAKMSPEYDVSEMEMDVVESIRLTCPSEISKQKVTREDVQGVDMLMTCQFMGDVGTKQSSWGFP